MISLLDTVRMKNGREVTVVGFDLGADGRKILEVCYDAWNLSTGKYGHTKIFVELSDIIENKHVITQS